MHWRVKSASPKAEVRASLTAKYRLFRLFRLSDSVSHLKLQLYGLLVALPLTHS